MSSETRSSATTIAHVLFLDIVGYSRQSTSAQGRLIQELTDAVKATQPYQRAHADGAVLPIPTGDGMALLFFADVEAPAACAGELARALHAKPSLPVRMGIHSGLVQRQIDIAGKENFVGEGINTANRVMEFGDAGHILLSQQYATWLQQFDEWRPAIHELGEGVAKHGLQLRVFALHSGRFGRADTPDRLSAASDAKAGKAVAAAQNVTVSQKIVLLYRRNTQPDEKVLQVLEDQLKAHGHDVFVDRHPKMAVEWARAVEERIRGADAVIAIVSPRALQSEMLEIELETAFDEQLKRGRPVILPVRIGPDEPTEGVIGALINPLNQFHWLSPDDDHRLVVELLSAIAEPLKPRSEEIKLEPVGGAVAPDSPFYVERSTDHEFLEALRNRESIILIKGARQMGKTSMQGRGVMEAREQGWRVAITDFQKLNAAQMSSEETFYKLLAATLGRQLQFKFDFQNDWMEVFGAGLNLENFLRDLLDTSSEPLVWFMDEVDKLFGIPSASDFFGLVRSWHNSRATEPGGPWTKLTIIIAYATEAHLFIQDLNQSPFNVGRRLDLEDFNIQQMVDLNARYGSPLSSYNEAEQLYALIGGQPFLTRRALDVLARGKLTFAELLDKAATEEGPFIDHLKRVLISVSRLDNVHEAIRKLLAGESVLDTDATYRLLAAGIVRKDARGAIVPRCVLYRWYLEENILEETAT